MLLSFLGSHDGRKRKTMGYIQYLKEEIKKKEQSIETALRLAERIQGHNKKTAEFFLNNAVKYEAEIEELKTKLETEERRRKK